MAAFPPPFGAGIAFGGTVPSGGGAGLGLNGINENLPKAPNFVEGGSYDPTDPVIVGGDGVHIDDTGWQVLNGARLTVNNGGTLRLDGTSADIDLKVTGGTPLVDVGNGGAVRILSGGSLDVFGTATLKNTSGPGSLVMEANTTMTVNSAATIALNSAEVSGGKFSHPLVLITSDTATRCHGVQWTFKAGEFTEDSSDAYIATVNNTTENVRASIPVPNGAVLNSVSVTIRGSTFFSALPGTMPVLTVYKINHATGVTTTLGTQTDTSATFGAYQTAHQITAAGLAATIARNVESVWVKVSTESGPNSSSGSLIYRSVSTSVSIANINGHD